MPTLYLPRSVYRSRRMLAFFNACSFLHRLYWAMPQIHVDYLWINILFRILILMKRFTEYREAKSNFIHAKTMLILYKILYIYI